MNNKIPTSLHLLKLVSEINFGSMTQFIMLLKLQCMNFKRLLDHLVTIERFKSKY